MAIFIAIILILGIALLAQTLNKKLALRICPACMAVSGTWLLLTAAVLFGYASKTDFLPIITLLMGGTIVGIAFQMEKSLVWANSRPLLSKMTVIVIGMPLAFWAAQNISAKMLLGETLVLVALAYLFFAKSASAKNLNANQIKELQEKLKDCC